MLYEQVIDRRRGRDALFEPLRHFILFNYKSVGMRIIVPYIGHSAPLNGRSTLRHHYSVSSVVFLSTAL